MDNLSPVRRSLFATEGDWEEKKKESFRFPIVHCALNYFHFNWNTQIELLHAEERGRKL